MLSKLKRLLAKIVRPRKKVRPELPFKHQISKQELDTLREQAEKNLKELSRIVSDGLKPPPGAYAFFNHSSHALSRLSDCKKILNRIYQQIYALVFLAIKSKRAESWPAGTPYPEELQKIFRKEDEINGYTQLDLETFYVFGGVLLDQWALQAIAVGNLSIKKQNLQKQNPFFELIRFFEDGNKSILDPIWNRLSEEMLWLHYQMRFYRNRFIVHANRPWQRGTARSSYGEEYNLHTPTPPGWLDDRTLDEKIKKLIPFAPEHIQKAPNDYWEKARPGALIERVFNNIGNVKRKDDRERIANLFGQKGGSTPSFQIIAKRLFHFVAESTELLCDIAKNNLKNIDLGRPHMTSKEMWKAREEDKN